jgi:hypothetical protein
MLTDPLDRVISAMWATRPYAAVPLRPVPLTGKCPTCRYWVTLPCQPCAQQVPVTRIDTGALVTALLAPSARTLAPKAQAILDLALAWVQRHPAQEITADLIEENDHFPFGKSHVYNHFGPCTRLNALAHMLADLAAAGDAHAH